MTFSSSIASWHAASAAARCGAETAMTTLVSPMSTRPTRWWIATSQSSCRSFSDVGQLGHDLLGHALVGLVLEMEDVATARACPGRARRRSRSRRPRPLRTSATAASSESGVSESRKPPPETGGMTATSSSGESSRSSPRSRG